MKRQKDCNEEKCDEKILYRKIDRRPEDISDCSAGFLLYCNGHPAGAQACNKAHHEQNNHTDLLPYGP